MNLTHILKSPFVPRSKRTLPRILIIKRNEMHYFSNLFGKELGQINVHHQES